MSETKTNLAGCDAADCDSIGVLLAALIVLLSANPVIAQEQKFVMFAPAQPAARSAAASQKPASSHNRPPLNRQPLKRPPALERVVLSSDQLFEPAKDLLSEAGEAKLRSLVPGLKEALADHPLVITAHIDKVGFERYNQELTQHQAERLKDWFVAHGVARSKAVIAKGVGSGSPLAPEPGGGKRPAGDGRFNNRVVEISVDTSRDIEADAVAAKPPAAGNNQASSAGQPIEQQDNLVESQTTLIPVTEDDLMPHFNGTGGQEGSKHPVNNDEWGGGGTNFGNNISNFGAQQPEYNEEGKRVMKMAPASELQEKQRKETIEAQNEFGLWRDR